MQHARFVSVGFGYCAAGSFEDETYWIFLTMVWLFGWDARTQ
jgi:hypothetical protein